MYCKLTRRQMLASLGAFALAGAGAAAFSGRTPAFAEATGDTREIEDYAGRKVTIPTQVDSVYCAVPTGEAWVATLAPTKLIAWVNQPTDAALAYLPESLAKLPAIGGWMGQKCTANIEDIISLAPDGIIYMGVSKSLAKDETPDQIQTQTGIPVICVPNALEATADVYRTLGEWVCEAERGAELGDFYEEHLKHMTELLDAIPEDEYPTIYYAEGADGLSTEPTGSQHTGAIDYCHAINIADVEMQSGQGMTPVSIEQVIGWDPEMILCHTGFVLAEDILDNPVWQDIQAVKNGRVYNTPAVPFNWFDRPPSMMRLMGIEWFAKLIYPEIDLDLEADLTDFFRLFYNVDLTAEQVEELCNQHEISFREAQ